MMSPISSNPSSGSERETGPQRPSTQVPEFRLTPPHPHPLDDDTRKRRRLRDPTVPQAYAPSFSGQSQHFPQPSMAPPRSHHPPPRTLSNHREVFGAILVTKVTTPRPEAPLFSTYTINPAVIREWGSLNSLELFHSQLQQPVTRTSFECQQKCISQVHELTIRNVPVKMAVEREMQGHTVMYWSEPNTGNDFCALAAPWV